MHFQAKLRTNPNIEALNRQEFAAWFKINLSGISYPNSTCVASLYMPADVTKNEHNGSYRRHNCYVCRSPYIAKTMLLPNLKPMWWCILLSVMWFKEILKTRNEFWELLHITIHGEQHNPEKWHDVYGLTCFVSSSLISHMMYTFFMVLADGSGKSLKYSTIEVIIHQTTWCGG